MNDELDDESYAITTKAKLQNRIQRQITFLLQDEYLQQRFFKELEKVTEDRKVRLRKRILQAGSKTLNFIDHVDRNVMGIAYPSKTTGFMQSAYIHEHHASIIERKKYLEEEKHK